jgi:microcompartment protein CcmK/EutM
LKEKAMLFARVIGTVVSTQKDEGIENRKLLLIQPVDIEFKEKGVPVVAVDAVGAGEGELVLYASGSSARQTVITKNTPCDAVIMAIVDTIEMNGEVIFKKFEKERL